MLIYAGNLSYRLTEDQLREAFEEFGQITSCIIIKDSMTGQSKGFGFLEMPDDNEARTAIGMMNGRDLKGRKPEVREARPRENEKRHSGRNVEGE